MREGLSQLRSGHDDVDGVDVAPDSAVLSSPPQHFSERIADRFSQGDRFGIERDGAAVQGEYEVVSPLDGPFEKAADRENGRFIASMRRSSVPFSCRPA
jgi:hypothetical protein